ncbi:MAG: hypothetical protein KGJ23_11345 [Euryarchaeota archaeon]|nr:hypothetical protein [Euryarchaeota archaeon]MDE1837189.1 hypothetical protein [Euryarchaeota archaeon]MDE1881685.1 hypothetical protein [Euryarchaeota archaeon]MDE2045345.1 hypothetical protein [Thermoplasmata archaeon]
MPAERLTEEEVAQFPCEECGHLLGTARHRTGGCTEAAHPAPCSVCGKVAMFLGWGDIRTRPGPSWAPRPPGSRPPGRPPFLRRVGVMGGLSACSWECEDTLEEELLEALERAPRSHAKF